jgi:hypothetical protein
MSADLKFHLLDDLVPRLARAHRLLDGMIFDGRNRARACIEAGVEPTCRPFTGDDAAACANIRRRHLNAEQKCELIVKLLRAKPEASNNAIARQARDNDKTVAKVRRDREARSEIPNVKARAAGEGGRRKLPPGQKRRPLPDCPVCECDASRRQIRRGTRLERLGQRDMVEKVFTFS